MAEESGDGMTPAQTEAPPPHRQQENESTSLGPTISVSRVNFNSALTNNERNGNSPQVDVEALELRNDLAVGRDVEITRLQRKWEFFPGKNHFYCDGRVMTAPSIRFCVLCFALILITFTLFIVFDGPFLTENLTVAIPIVGSILFVSVVVNMIKTSFSDPGILPRATQQEADHLEKSYYSTNFRPPPRTKDIVVNGQVIKSKYCFTCKMFRPPRASHCGICDNCVDRFDHHCPFLGNCIGKRNYRSFYAFIVSLSFLAVFILSASIAHLVMLSKDRNNFLEALRESPSSAVVILISFFGMWTVIGLTGFHTYLIAVEQTTNEDIKGLFGRANAKNPFSHGNFCQNCCFVLCGPSQPSLLDPRGFATVEFIQSLPQKSDNPNGMLSPDKAQQPIPTKVVTNNSINDPHQLNHQNQGGPPPFSGTNKVFREHPPPAQAAQPIQHQPLQFSSSPSSTTTLEGNHEMLSNKPSISGLPSIPSEEKILLKGQARNGRTDYRQTIPGPSAIEEIQMSQQEALISPSAASTVSLSTLSTSNMSSTNGYDTVGSPTGGGVGDENNRGGKVPNLPPSVRHQFNKNTRLNANNGKRFFSSSSTDHLDDIVDPSDFDDDLDMPSLSNINEMDISLRRQHNCRANNSNNNKAAFSGGTSVLSKSTRSLPSTSIGDNGEDLGRIHVLGNNSSKSFVNSTKAIITSSSSSLKNNQLGNNNGVGKGTKAINGSSNNKRNLDSTMQNSPLHLDTIM